MGTQVIWFLGLLGTELFSYVFVMSIIQNALLPATVNTWISQGRDDSNVSGIEKKKYIYGWIYSEPQLWHKYHKEKTN